MSSVNQGSTSEIAVHKRPGHAAKWLLRAPTKLYDLHAGWLLDHRFLRLTHVGRRSGRRYRTMLEVVSADVERDEYVVVAGLGERADWYRNVRAGGAVEVAIGNRRFKPAYRQLTELEAAAAFARYEHDHHWAAPMIRRALTWLVGWDYDASPSARRRLAHEVPLLAFQPAQGTENPPRSDETRMPAGGSGASG